MRIQLLHFASFRDAIGRETEVIELSEGARVSDLWERLKRDNPYFRAFLTAPPAAVNRGYVPGDRVLAD
ncbi:MAG TPA: molybdenum cofactor biosynthesis protein MoaE, partial [Thermoanaerobaculia bacterium]